MSRRPPRARSSATAFLWRAPRKIAAEALLAPIRQHSADVETFISETIKRVNNVNDDNVKLLLGGDASTANKAKAVDLLLSIAHVPMERVHTIRLQAEVAQSPELWLRSFNGQKWLYFNPETGEQGLPADRLIWWIGDGELVSLEGGRQATVSFSLNNSEMNAIRLAKLTDENTDASFLEYSLYGLPLQTQQTYQVMMMIPIGVLVILILRNLGGLQNPGHLHPGADRPGLPRNPAGLRYLFVYRDHCTRPVTTLVPRTSEAADVAAPVGGA